MYCTISNGSDSSLLIFALCLARGGGGEGRVSELPSSWKPVKGPRHPSRLVQDPHPGLSRRALSISSQVEQGKKK